MSYLVTPLPQTELYLHNIGYHLAESREVRRGTGSIRLGYLDLGGWYKQKHYCTRTPTCDLSDHVSTLEVSLRLLVCLDPRTIGVTNHPIHRLGSDGIYV